MTEGAHNKLPNRHLATIDETKIRFYLLSDTHPAGRTKAAFFRRFGFRVSSPQILHEALLAHSRDAEIASFSETEFGQKYIVEGQLNTPDGRNPQIRTVWFVSGHSNIPRLVTAYPVRGV